MFKKTMRVATQAAVKVGVKVGVTVIVGAAALASLQAWQAGAGAPPSRAVAVNDAGTDNPLFDMGGTFYTLEARAVRVRTRFAQGTAIAERAPDGDIRARLTDPFGNPTRELVVDMTGGWSSRLHVRDAQGSVTESAVTRAEVRPTLDWAALQLHAIDSDLSGPREWRGRFLRSKSARRVNLDDEPLEVETEFETGLRSTTTRVNDKRLGVIYRTTVSDGGTEVGWMAWRQQSKTLAFEFKGLTAGTISEKSLERYGGWRFQPTLSWANIQGFAYYDFGVRLRASGRLARAGTVTGSTTVAAVSERAAETRLTAAIDPNRVRRSPGEGGARQSPGPRPLLRRFADMFVATVQANEEGCDNLHWLDNSMFRYCCDMHDACYEKQGCSASSWRWPFSGWSCTRCNLQAIYCFSTIESNDIDSLLCEWVHWQFNVWLPGCGGGA